MGSQPLFSIFSIFVGVQLRHLLMKLADGGEGYLAAPQGLCDVLHTAHGDAGQIHLDERFL